MFKSFLLVANTQNITNHKVVILAVKQDPYLTFNVIVCKDKLIKDILNQTGKYSSHG